MTGTLNEMGRAGVVPLLGGSVLTAAGLRRGGLTGLLLAGVGGWLAYRGYRRVTAAAGESPAGHDQAKCDVLLNTVGAGVTAGIYDHVSQHAKEQRTAAGDPIDDPVLEASDDSFPCSDPPSFSPRTEEGALV